MRRLPLVLALGFCWSTASAARPEELTIGDPAPRLSVGEFIKGEPIEGFERGKVYVVEFWATWCGPCKTSIPHLTGLQKAHPEARFLGVSVLEQDFADVRPFVQAMGDAMAYTVATDLVPPGKTPQDGVMSKAWLEAAGEAGIPSAFLVDRDGKVAWIGHPMSLDPVLDKVLAGTWDLAAARTARDREKAQERKQLALQRTLQKAARGGDASLLKAIDAAISEDPGLESKLGIQKFLLLNKMNTSRPQALAYGSRLVDVIYKDEAQALVNVAWSLVGGDEDHKPDPESARLGLRAALRADLLAESKDFAIADVLARAYFVNADRSQAIRTQERALKLAEAAPEVDSSSLKEHLEEYRQVAHPR